MTTGTKLQIIQNRNLRFILPSGITMSIGIGAGSYSDNNNAKFIDSTSEDYAPTQCMEIAFLQNDEFVVVGDFEQGQYPDDVVGYVPVDRLPMILANAMMSNWKAVEYQCLRASYPDVPEEQAL